MNPDEIRVAVEKGLGSPLQPSEWTYLLEHDHVSEVESGIGDVATLVAAVRELRQAFRRASAPVMLEKPETLHRQARPDHATALSVLLAKLADQDFEVQRYRDDVLEGRLLSPDEVEGWIRRALDSGLKGRTFGRDMFTAPAVAPADAEDTNDSVLEYGVPGDPEKRMVVVFGPFHPLNRLTRVSDTLARRFNWFRAQATLFILTGLPPSVRSLTIAYEPNADQSSATTRIILTVDPTLPPSEVSDQYKRARQRILPGRYRRLGSKHIALALFAATRPESEQLADRLRVWNTEHPEWAYGLAGKRNFARDCSIAQRRILNPPITWL
jgi:hypothetical protein